MDIKNAIRSRMSFMEFSNSGYTIKKGCKIFDAGNQVEEVRWHRQVWERMVMPKHRFLFWLVMHRRLRTRENLWQLGLISENLCLLCGMRVESIEHLYFECTYSKECISKVRKQLEWNSKGNTLNEVLRWVKNAKVTNLKKRCMYSIIAAIVHHIWRVRNDVFWQDKLWTINNTV